MGSVGSSEEVFAMKNPVKGDEGKQEQVERDEEADSIVVGMQVEMRTSIECNAVNRDESEASTLSFSKEVSFMCS